MRDIVVRQMFEVLLRFTGLLLCLYGLGSLVAMAVLYFQPGAAGTRWMALPSAAAVLFGAYLLRGAPHVMRFSFPPHER